MRGLLGNNIIKNFVSLSAGEIVRKIISFFTLVYLARVISPEGFGILGFAIAIVYFFGLVVNFGIDTIATRDLSRDRTLIPKYVNNILTFRLLLSIGSFFLLSIFILLIDKTPTYKIVILLTGLSLLFNATILNFVFLAIEKMKYVAIRQISTSILSLIAIMVFVNTEADLIIASAIFSISLIVNSFLLLFLYRKKYFAINLSLDRIFLKNIIRESYPLLVSSIMISVYYNIDLIMLGFMRTPEEVGIYNAAYKIFMIAILPFGLLFKAFTPTLAKYSGNDRAITFSVFKYYALIILAFGVLAFLILFIFSEQLVILIFGIEYIRAAVPLLLLALNALVISINMSIGQPLTLWGYQKTYSIAISIGAIANIILNFIFIPEYGYLGAAFATMLTEVVVFVGLLFIFIRNMKNLF